jgi:hypothetical protein
MTVYGVEIEVAATLYIKATSKAQAHAIAERLCGQSTEAIPVSGLQYDDPDLPDVSLSPAATILSLLGDPEPAGL